MKEANKETKDASKKIKNIYQRCPIKSTKDAYVAKKKKSKKKNPYYAVKNQNAIKN